MRRLDAALTDPGAFDPAGSASREEARARKAEADLAGVVAAKADLVGGKIPAAQLPSYVDDVLEYDSQSGFPQPGESGKLYIDKSANRTYRWSGTLYVAVGGDLALGETESTAGRGDHTKAAWDHSRSKGNVHEVSFDEFKDKPSIPPEVTERTVSGWGFGKSADFEKALKAKRDMTDMFTQWEFSGEAVAFHHQLNIREDPDLGIRALYDGDEILVDAMIDSDVSQGFESVPYGEGFYSAVVATRKVIATTSDIDEAVKLTPHYTYRYTPWVFKDIDGATIERKLAYNLSEGVWQFFLPEQSPEAGAVGTDVYIGSRWNPTLPRATGVDALEGVTAICAIANTVLGTRERVAVIDRYTTEKGEEILAGSKSALLAGADFKAAVDGETKVNASTALALKDRDCCLVPFAANMTFTFAAKEEGRTGLRSFEVIVTGCVKDGAVNWPAVTYRGDSTDLIPEEGDNHWTFAEQQDGSFAVMRHVANTITIGE